MNLLPLTLEREYMALRARLFDDLFELVEQTILRSSRQRADGRDELAMLLGLTPEALLDRKKIEARLRKLAKDLDSTAVRKLEAAMGRKLKGASFGTLETWVATQTDIIIEEVRAYLAEAATELALQVGPSGGLKAAAKKARDLSKIAREKAKTRASFAVLGLNAQLIEEVAVGGGSQAYKWITEKDSRVREHHAALESTVQTWTNPPLGGGTNADDFGHPGSGWGCRCVPEPIV